MISFIVALTWLSGQAHFARHKIDCEIAIGQQASPNQSLIRRQADLHVPASVKELNPTREKQVGLFSAVGEHRDSSSSKLDAKLLGNVDRQTDITIEARVNDRLDDLGPARTADDDFRFGRHNLQQMRRPGPPSTRQTYIGPSGQRARKPSQAS